MKKEKYLQVFNYLLEFSKLRSNPVRNIENAESQYPEKIWFADIPQCEIFDCITFPEYNEDADYWIRISKPKNEPQPPTFPKLSLSLTDWVDKDSLKNENSTPFLFESIVKYGNTIQLSDKPEIEREFQNYLNEKWIDDLDFYKKELGKYEITHAEYQKQLKTYEHFFRIHNKAKQFGEEYELIVSVGLLYFQEDLNTPLICRHILTSKAEIEFKSSIKESFIKVFPGIENEIKLETDAIIDLIEQFDSSNIIDAERAVIDFLKEKNITDDLFDSNIKDALQIFSDRLRTDGKAEDDLEKPKFTPKNPTVYFAPILILRKRNTRSLTALYEKIIENINDASDLIDIPSINDIIGEFEDRPISEDENVVDCSKNDIIYFPKKFNDEQIEIIEKAKRNKKVLVQGPPGTGKTHTIANLICHLLAHGKKVLVTAYTTRALKVLKEKLPEEFQNLAVNILSGDSSSISDLDKSINGINDELSNYTNPFNYRKEVEEKEMELELIKEQKATTINELLKIKEKATRRQVINQNYQGTLLEIAERVEKEHDDFLWFEDSFSDISQIEIIDELEGFIALVKKYQKIECKIFDLEIPKKDRIISLIELKEYQRTKSELTLKYSSKNGQNIIKCKDYESVKNNLVKIHDLFVEIENNVLPIKSKLLVDYKTNSSSWKEIITRTNLLLSELQEDKLKQIDRSVQITYPPNKTLIEIKSDAEILLQLLKEGKRIVGLLSVFNNPLTPSNIKQRKYFIHGVKVNGSDCDTIKEFEAVLEDIKIKQDIEELEEVWGIKPNGNSKTFFEKIKFFKKLLLDTNELLNILSEVQKLKSQIENVSSFKIQNYNSKEIQDLIFECEYNQLLLKSWKLNDKITESIKYLTSIGIHPIANKIQEAIENIELEQFEQYLSEIENIHLEKENYCNYKTLKNKLLKYFPKTVQQIIDNTFNLQNLLHIENAIYFKHVTAEILKLFEVDYEEKLSVKLLDIERNEEKLTSVVASKKAWLYILESLTNDPLLRRHLQAWVLAVKKIGKTGKGKRALKFRKEAQQQMEHCKDSIPCWIMPLYKVAETINPEQGMYDYVIIDEASQLGADAIFLMYISKNIIIVGDDKQTSPEYVGVDTNTMTPYINRHLHDIPFANYYGTEFSFFDHAKMLCNNGMTVLREHFRCMPEIIEFSNRHFYYPDGKGLYPLKQYSENRLQPLMSYYCQSGYVEGSYQNITNRIEAEAVANKIAELIYDIQYNEKSFGVIALQGTRQAELIDGMILKKIGEVEYKKRNIICGNSASFQGDERDIMFLSLITAHNHKRQALTDDNDKRRFNVAVSRAKEQVWLFHSVLPEDLSNKEDLRHKLLDHFLNPEPQIIPQSRIYERTMGAQPDPFESWFEVDVYNDIVKNNYKVIPQYKVAKGKYRIDLVIILSNGIKIAIECDGDKFHGAEQYENDLMRQKVLERCGWQFFRVRGAEYYSNRKKSLEPLWSLLHANEIKFEEASSSKLHDEEPEENMKDFSDELGSEKNEQTFRKDVRNTEPDLFNYENEIKPVVSSCEETNKPVKISSNLSSFSEILVFTTQQNIYKIQNRYFSNQSQVLSQLELEPGERALYITGTNNYSGFLIVAFQNGKVGKISMTSYYTEHNRKKLRNAFNNESKLIFIEYIEDDIDLIALSSIKKVVLFNTSQINPVESRNTKGVQVMKQKDGSFMEKVKRAEQAILNDAEYYRKSEGLNVVGYYLKLGDEI